jgi:hypothetical protein
MHAMRDLGIKETPMNLNPPWHQKLFREFGLKLSDADA